MLVRPRDRRLAAERDQRERRERGEHRDERRRQVQPPVRAVGDHVLLADQLAEVGDRLQEAERADAVGAVARLHAADQLALEDGHEREEGHQPVGEDERLDQRDEHPVRHQSAPLDGRGAVDGRAVPGEAHGAGRRACARARAVPVVAPPAWRTVTARALGDAEPLGVGAGDHDLVAALEARAARCARPRRRRRAGGGRSRRGPRRPASATSGGGRRGRRARRRRRGRAAASGACSPIVSQVRPANSGAAAATRANARDGLASSSSSRCAAGGREARRARARRRPAAARTAAGAACGPRGSSSCRPSRAPTVAGRMTCAQSARRRREERARDDRLAALQRRLPALRLGEARERVRVAEHDEHLQRAVLGAAQHVGRVVAVAERVQRRARSGPPGTASTPPRLAGEAGGVRGRGGGGDGGAGSVAISTGVRGAARSASAIVAGRRCAPPATWSRSRRRRCPASSRRAPRRTAWRTRSSSTPAASPSSRSPATTITSARSRSAMRAAYGRERVPVARAPRSRVLTSAPPPARARARPRRAPPRCVCSPEATTAIESGPCRLAWWRRRRAIVSASCSALDGLEPARAAHERRAGSGRRRSGGRARSGRGRTASPRRPRGGCARGCAATSPSRTVRPDVAARPGSSPHTRRDVVDLPRAAP